MSKHALDIIITHYNEPAETGEPMFQMLKQQRLVDYRNVHIIIVQDGLDGAFDWPAFLHGFPYSWEIVNIPHSGLSAARNAGIEHATGDFIMFCDFDDMFSDVWSLCLIMKVLPTENYDILWMPYTQEVRVRGKYYQIAKHTENTPESVAKVFRRQFLMDKNLRFDTRLQMCEDLLFYSECVEETSIKRYGKLDTEIVFPYCATYRDGSMSHTQSRETYIRKMYNYLMRDIYFMQWLQARGKKIVPQLTTPLFEFYCLLNREDVPDEFSPAEEAFARFYLANKPEFDAVRPEDYEYAQSIIKRQMINMDVINFCDYGVEAQPVNENVSVQEWLSALERKYSPPAERTEPSANVPQRVAVYTGTRNVYENMLVSAKSLIANSNVERVYFLIEDDTFPYELPPIIRTRNVSNQKFFTEDSPNFDTAWTYMCLLRGAFPKIFPEYSKILSMDIDTIAVDDVSELWNMDLSDYYFAGVEEQDDKKHGVYHEDGHAYFNFGVIMLNLDKLRADGMDDRIIHAMNTTKYSFPEQDPYNLFCDGQTLPISSEYNNTVFYHLTAETDSPKINHYAGITYYKNYTSYQHYLKMPWTEVLERNAAKRKDVIS